jgi:hypothetical protein
MKKREEEEKARLPQPLVSPTYEVREYPITQQQPQRPIFLSRPPSSCSRRDEPPFGRAKQEGIQQEASLGRPHLPHPPPCAPHPPPSLASVHLSPSVSPSPLSLCPLIARRRWCREPCAGAGGGRGAAACGWWSREERGAVALFPLHSSPPSLALAAS